MKPIGACIFMVCFLMIFASLVEVSVVPYQWLGRSPSYHEVLTPVQLPRRLQNHHHHTQAATTTTPQTSLAMDQEEKKQVQSIRDQLKGHSLPDGGEIVKSINSSSSEFNATNNRAHIVRQYESGSTASDRKTTRGTPDRKWITFSLFSLEDLRQYFVRKLIKAVSVCILLAIYIFCSKVSLHLRASHRRADVAAQKKSEKEESNLEGLQKCFGLKRAEAAAKLHVSVSTFKRACRKHGIPDWQKWMGSSGSVWKTPDPHERNTSPTCKTTSSHGQTEMENQMVGRLHEPNEHLSDFFDGPVFWNTESSVAGILESPTFHDLDMDFTFSSVFEESEEARGQQTDQSTLSDPCLEGQGSRSSYGIVVPTCSDPASTQPMPIISHPMPTMPPLTQSQDTSSVTVKATYGDDIIKFQLPLTSGIIELKKEVAERFKFELDSFNLKYEDEDGDWIWIPCDKDLRSYLQGFSSLVNLVIRLLVVKVAKRT